MTRPTAPLVALVLTAGGCSLAASPQYEPAPTERVAQEVAATSVAGDVGSLATVDADGTTTSRKVIRTVRIELRSNSPAEALARARQFTLAHGGFIDRSNAGGAGLSTASVEATFRVPADALEAAIDFLRGLGTVLRVTEEGEDVTEQLVDLGARLTAKRELEARLIDLTARTGAVDDLLRVEQELARVRSEIEVMDARQRGIEDRVAYATLNLHVEAPVQPIAFAAESFGSRLANAWSRGFRTAGDMIVGALELSTSASPLLALAALFVFPWQRRRRRAVRRATAA